MRRLALLAVVVMLVLPACAWPGSSTSGCRNVMIDWVDFVMVGSTQYVAGLESTSAVQLEPSDLGPVIEHVKFRVDGNVCDTGYVPKDGDAAFYDPGTPIYSVNGKAVAELVALERDGRVIPYAPWHGASP